MATIPTGVWPIDPTATSGSELAAYLNDWVNAFLSQSANATRPATIQRGGVWAKTLGASDIALMLYDGTTDHEIGKVIGGNASFGGGTNAGTTAPTSPAVGDLWYDTANAVLMVYDGANWAKLDPGNAIYSESFLGDGVKAVFALTNDPGIIDHTLVYIDGVYQNKAGYAVAGTTLTFSAPPPLNSDIEAVVVSATLAPIGTTTSSAVTHTSSVPGSTPTTVEAELNTLEVGLAALTSGDMSIAGNLVLQNGKGIDFSATPGTGTSELFDDYEEGTYTADLYEDGGSTLKTVTGNYTKVGNIVTINFESAGGTTGGSGEVRSNLPFTADETFSNTIAYSFSNGSMVAGFTLGNGYLNFVDTVGSIGGGNKMIGSDIGSGSRLYFSLTYRTPS